MAPTNGKKTDGPATMLSHAAGQFCEAVRVAVAAGLSDAKVNSRVRRVRNFVDHALSNRRRERWDAGIDWSTILKPKPPPSDDELRQRQAQVAAEYAARQARFAAERAAREAREKELIRERELRIELVKAGHRALAKKYHPDVGGSSDDMVRLTRIRDRLKP